MVDLFIKGPLVVAFLCLIGMLCLFLQYRNLLKFKIIKFANLLLLLRSIVFFVLLYLLINPLIQYNQTYISKPKIGLFIDSSNSIGIHQSLDSMDYKNRFSLLIDDLNDNEFETKIFEFSDSVSIVDNSQDIIFEDKITSFDFLDNKTIDHSLDKIILITDGISTFGKKIEQLSIDLPVYSIGIGENHFIEDIEINKIVYDEKIKFNDSLELKYAIKYFLKENKTSKLIIRNNLEEVLYSSMIYFKNGEGMIDGHLKISSADFTSVNAIILEPLDIEINKRNNSRVFSLDIIDKPKSILLISGTISNNTFVIKKSIGRKKNISLDHFYRLNNNKWNKNLNKIRQDQYDLIIFDDYTSKNEVLFNNNQSTIYFEGPTSFNYDHKYLNDIFNINSMVNKEQLSQQIIDNIGFNNLNIESLTRFKKNYDFYSNNNSNNVLVNYSDNSIAIVRNNNDLGVFIPDLGNNYRKNNNPDEKNILEGLLGLLIDTALEKDLSLVKLKDLNHEYFIGEPIKIYIEYSSLVNPLDINNSLKIKASIDTLIQLLDISYDYKNDKYYSLFEPTTNGLWKIKGEMNYRDELVLLKTLSVLIQDSYIESKFISQNIDGLKLLSKRTGGEYIDLIDITKGNSFLSFSDLIKNELVEINIINNFSYLWVIILFLGIEWYLRKKKGLL